MDNSKVKWAYHDGRNVAGQIIEWWGTDAEATYNLNVKDFAKAAYIESQGWRPEDKKLVYRFNKHGFRSDEFTDEPCVLALGCSHTIGIGLEENQTWCHWLSHYTGLKLFNLGWGGSSADTAFRYLSYWISRFNVKLVAVLLPPAQRFDLFFDKQMSGHWTIPVVSFMPRHLSDTWNSNDQVLNNWFANEVNAEINREKNRLAIQQLCLNHCVPCLINDCEFLNNRTQTSIDWARDFMHAGPVVHKKLGLKFYNDWNETQHQ